MIVAYHFEADNILLCPGCTDISQILPEDSVSAVSKLVLDAYVGSSGEHNCDYCGATL